MSSVKSKLNLDYVKILTTNITDPNINDPRNHKKYKHLNDEDFKTFMTILANTISKCITTNTKTFSFSQNLQNLKSNLTFLYEYAEFLIDSKGPHYFQGRILMNYCVILGIKTSDKIPESRDAEYLYRKYLETFEQEFNNSLNSDTGSWNIDNISRSLKDFLHLKGSKQDNINLNDFIKTEIDNFKQFDKNNKLPKEFSKLSKNLGLAIAACIACIALTVGSLATAPYILLGTSAVACLTALVLGGGTLAPMCAGGGLAFSTITNACILTSAYSITAAYTIAPAVGAIYCAVQGFKNPAYQQSLNQEQKNNLDAANNVIEKFYNMKLLSDKPSGNLLDPNSKDKVRE